MTSAAPEPTPRYANDFIEQHLDECASSLAAHCDGDILAFSGDLYFPVDDEVRKVVEKMRARRGSHKKLIVVLTTSGGYIEVVQRMVDTFRHHYKIVDFIVPNYAYSAGTVLALSGDAIHMNYFSRMGPIDPQVHSNRGLPVPALGYLIQYERLLKKARDGTITGPEVTVLLQFDQAELYYIEQARELSVELLKRWLVKYKFKNWRVTEKRKIPVTAKMKAARAEEIARELNNHARWHSHGHGISMDVLRKNLKLIIDDFDLDPKLSKAISAYQSLLDDYMIKRGNVGVLHAVGQYVPFMSL